MNLAVVRHFAGNGFLAVVYADAACILHGNHAAVLHALVGGTCVVRHAAALAHRNDAEVHGRAVGPDAHALAGRRHGAVHINVALVQNGVGVAVSAAHALGIAVRHPDLPLLYSGLPETPVTAMGLLSSEDVFFPETRIFFSFSMVTELC